MIDLNGLLELFVLIVVISGFLIGNKWFPYWEQVVSTVGTTRFHSHF